MPFFLKKNQNPYLKNKNNKSIEEKAQTFLIYTFAKNILLIISTYYLYHLTYEVYSIYKGKDVLDTLMLFVGLLIVVPLFGCFSFTYETIDLNSKAQVSIAHIFTFLITLATFELVIMIDVIFILLIDDIILFRVTLYSLFLSIVLYDSWDAFRLANRHFYSLKTVPNLT